MLIGKRTLVCDMAPKRFNSPAAADAQELKRTRSAVDEAISEFVCPITQVLPIDPVTAEDGKVYERSAITEWLEKHQRSPLTNEPMDTRLTAAHQVKNMIRTMITTGVYKGDKAQAWQQVLKDEAVLEKWRAGAERGEGVAMEHLGSSYKTGRRGLNADKAKAYEWYLKSHETGCVRGTVALGQCYLEGAGVAMNTALAAVYSTSAAKDGSKLACCNLGICFQNGGSGFPKDLKQARYWYQRAQEAGMNDIRPDDLTRSANWLRDNPAS